MELNKIYNEDCLEGMKRIPDGSVDMILCDLPYGTTACKWDTIIPFDPLWEQYERVIKDNGAIVLTASQPFTSALVMSNPQQFKYEWVWDKVRATNFMSAKKEPLRRHESVLVFGTPRTTYNWQPLELTDGGKRRNNRARVSKHEKKESVYGDTSGLKMPTYEGKEFGYPKSILTIPREQNNQYSKPVVHPTQKPVALFEYLIKTYTNKNETVLDNCMGSGTTAIACMNTERNYIGFELDKTYHEKSLERIKNHTTQTDIFDLLEGE